MSTAAQAVDQLVSRSGLTKAELSRRSGVSRAQIDRYLKGVSQPSVAQLERLGRAADLALSVTWSTRTSTPGWATPQESMTARATSVAERAALLERVVPVAMELRRTVRTELGFPPFRSLLTVS